MKVRLPLKLWRILVRFTCCTRSPFDRTGQSGVSQGTCQDIEKFRRSFFSWFKTISQKQHNFLIYRMRKYRNRPKEHLIMLNIVKWLVLLYLMTRFPKLVSSATLMPKLNISFQLASSSACSASGLTIVSKSARKHSSLICHPALNLLVSLMWGPRPGRNRELEGSQNSPE